MVKGPDNFKINIHCQINHVHSHDENSRSACFDFILSLGLALNMKY